jgi:O-methyltransferase
MAEYCVEYSGGLGDVLEQIHHTPHYRRLAFIEPGDHVVIVLICHCPTVTQLFEWHPHREQLTVLNPGYWWPSEMDRRRQAHGLPAPTGLPQGCEEPDVVLHVSPNDRALLRDLPEKYIVLAPTAGQPERDIPRGVVLDFLDRVRAKCLPTVAIGANYPRSGRQEFEYPESEYIINLVDRLSVPGAFAAIRGALGGLYSFSSMHLAAKLCGPAPQLLLYPASILPQHADQVRAQWPFIAHALFEGYDGRLFDRFWGRVLFAQRLRAEGGFRSLMPVEGLQALHETVLETNQIPGSLLEVGVYRGGSSRLMALTNPAKRLFACDTFAGACDVDPSIDQIAAGRFASDFTEVVGYLADVSNATLIPGPFSESQRLLEREVFSCVHIDVDTYRGTRQVLEFAYPRLTQGGRILSDDYFWHECPGVRKAIDEFFCDKPETIRPIGANHIVVQKI